MKKILSILVVMMLFCSCNKNNTTTPKPIEFNGYDFEKVINNDLSIYRGSNFYGTSAEFDTNLLLDSAKVIKITNLFERNGDCIQINHLPDGTIVVTRVDFITFRNNPINYEDSVGLSLKGVIETLKSDSLCYWLDTKTISLCQPKRGSSLYVIGEGLVLINAQTGKIKR